MCDVNWLFNVTINDISVIYVTTRSARPSTDTGPTFHLENMSYRELHKKLRNYRRLANYHLMKQEGYARPPYCWNEFENTSIYMSGNHLINYHKYPKSVEIDFCDSRVVLEFYFTSIKIITVYTENDSSIQRTL